ncbi:DNA primase [Serratia phage Eta]|uniref:Putative DNA primase n=1 Tax=Serratia phage Eta TaxID=1282995 RepID=R9VYI0_9CAUD|nr:DNA primase [Serratia phage Eta]AGN89460.1 putative DNA primase [Serratia phage Eta]
MNLIFPLTLSCGHLASGTCDCWKGVYQFNPNGDSPIDRVLREYNGAWRQTLEGYGCKLPNGRHHGPCPVCGGKDRFRFDDKDGRGTWFCSQCDTQSGGGLLLLSRYLGKPTIEVAKELIGQDMPRTIAPVRKHSATDEQMRDELRKRAKRGAEMLMEHSQQASHPYMDGKGLHGEWLVNSQIMMGADQERIEPGALLLVPVYKNGELVNVQKISAEGKKRPIYGGDMSGVCHVISGTGKIVAITEGFATGVTVNRMTNATTYVAFNTGNLMAITAQARAENPDSNVVIFADNDEHGAGLKYAEEASVPVNAKIALPPEVGDWDDYRQKYGAESCKVAMREAIKLDGKPKKDSEHLAAAKKLAQEARELADNIRCEEAKEVKQAEERSPLIVPGIYLPGCSPAEEVKVNIAESDEPYHHKGEVPDGMDLSKIDIDNPPGLPGRIVNYIRDGAHRELTGGAYAVMALQCIAIAASGLKCYGGGKTSLITIILALSGSGKERAQSVIKSILTEAGRKVYGDIRSDKDVIMTTMYDAGRAAYIVDEAHKFLIQPKNSSGSYAANISTTLMELATTDNFKPARNHVGEVEASIRNSLSRLEKEKLALEECIGHCNPEYDGAKIKQYEMQIQKKAERIATEEAALHMLETGIPNPCLNLAGSSTPGKLSQMVNTDNIDSGLLARAIVVDCGETRARLNMRLTGVDVSMLNIHDRNDIIRDIALIAADADKAMRSDTEREFNEESPVMEVIATEDATAAIDLIKLHYDQDRYRNHEQIGSMYARIAERVQSLSSLIALGNIKNGKAVIEVEFVHYSLALIIKSFDNLISNLKLNAAVDGDDITDKVNAIQEKIIRRLKSSNGEQVFMASVKQSITKAAYYKEIQKALTGTGQDAFQNAITMLQMTGKIVVEGKVIRLP